MVIFGNVTVVTLFHNRESTNKNRHAERPTRIAKLKSDKRLLPNASAKISFSNFPQASPNYVPDNRYRWL